MRVCKDMIVELADDTEVTARLKAYSGRKIRKGSTGKVLAVHRLSNDPSVLIKWYGHRGPIAVKASALKILTEVI